MPVAYRVIVTPRAFTDLDTILTEVGAKSPSGASRLISDLLREMEQLRQFPHRHALVQGRKHPAGPVRRMPVLPYVVYYRTHDATATVRVLTVLHGRRRRPRSFE